MNQYTRKRIRLPNYDYSTNGAYYITICTKNRESLFWKQTNRMENFGDFHYSLSDYGTIVEQAVHNISLHYKNVSVPKYVIMPDHLHMIILLQSATDESAPKISTIINQMKGFVTKQIGFSPWQKLFYDHIIRNEKEYNQICEYIDSKPIRRKSIPFQDN